MDFLKLLRSLEELLFEILSWLIFYPLTVWRVLTAPVAIMVYSDAEQKDEADEAYTDTLSPGFFLIITLLMVHAAELAIGFETQFNSALGELVTASDENLVITRSLLFGLFPLVFSVLLLKARAQKIDRNQLRAPFFAQCYVTALYALLFNISMFAIAYTQNPVLNLLGVLSLPAVTIAFVAIEAIWLRRQAKLSWGSAFGLALLGIVIAVALLAGAAFLIGR